MFYIINEGIDHYLIIIILMTEVFFLKIFQNWLVNIKLQSFISELNLVTKF